MILSDGVVRLRPWRPGDAGAIAGAAVDSAIARWSGIADGVDAWLARQHRPEVTSLAIALTTDDHARGCVHLRHHDREIGYWVLREHRGQGLARRAVILLAHHVREQGVRDLRMEIESDNEPSLRVAAAVGAQPTGERVTEADRDGIVRELLRFRL